MSLKLSDAVEECVLQSPFLASGFTMGILNFASLSRMLVPQISARLKSKVSETALHKALTRLSISRSKGQPKSHEHRLDGLSVRSDLTVLTCARLPKNHAIVGRWYEKARKEEKFFSITESTREITVVCDSLLGAEMTKELQPYLSHKNVASLHASFHKKYLSQPGFIVAILQQLSIQGINIIEVSSTATELVIFLSNQQIRLAFDTLYYAFLERNSR